MPSKTARRRCIRLLNAFKCLLVETKAPLLFSRAAAAGQRRALLFADLEKSIQYLKRRVRKNSGASHRHDPLLLHIFHLHYAVQLLTGRQECITYFFCAQQSLRASHWWLATMVRADAEFVQSVTGACEDTVWHAWEKSRGMVLRALSDDGDGEVLLRCCALAYAGKVLCYGHDRPPAASSLFRMAMQREATGAVLRQTERLSPTQLVRWQGQRGVYCGFYADFLGYH